MMQNNLNEPAGILLVNKPKGKTSFSLVAMLRRILKVKKIGHAGTLDPFATGVMVMLIGKQYTRMSDQFLCQDKEYIAKVHLGVTTDTYDIEGQILETSNFIPSLENVKNAIEKFQGFILQVPPMFSAKKVKGKKLYELARNGITIERSAREVHVKISMLSYEYPHLDIHVSCSKGTYIRSLAYDIGQHLGCGAHLAALQRTRSGSFILEKCIDGALLQNPSEELNIAAHLIQDASALSL
jgi:tRNA pseudouridine55 synthase